MAVHKKSFYPGSTASVVRRVLVSQNMTAGQIAVFEDGVAVAGEIKNPLVADADDYMGLVADDVSIVTDLSELQAEFPVNTLNTAIILFDPYAVLEFQANGGATSDTPLSTVDPVNILTAEASNAGGVLIEEADVGAVAMTGGQLIGSRGANAGRIRKQTATVAATSVAVAQRFPYAIAAGDQFIRLPWAIGSKAIQLTTDFSGANAIAAFGVGADFRVSNIIFDHINDRAVVHATPGNSVFGAAAAGGA